MCALRRGAAAIAAVFAAVSLSGCLASLQDGPERLVPVSQQVADVRAQFSAVDPAYDTWPEAQRVEYRNDFILAQMRGIDALYSKYETALTRERQELGFAADTTNLALTGTATLISPAVTKSILSGVASFVTGTRASYNDDILLSKTIQVLQNQMRTNRTKVSSLILGNLGLSTAAYPLAVAQLDLEQYYQAGTLTSALIDVSNQVGQEAINAKYENTAIVVPQPATDPTYTALMALLYPKGVSGGIDTKVRDYLRTLLGSNYTSLPNYVNMPRYATLRLAMINCIKAYQLNKSTCTSTTLVIPK